MKSRYHNKRKQFHLLWVAFIVAILFGVTVPGFAPGVPKPRQAAVALPAEPLALAAPPAASPATRLYPVHPDIVASMFYVGESGTSDNGFIPNRASTWDEQWQVHYGGVDSPTRRGDWRPSGFTPKQNPFYVALPYNDLNGNDERKASAHSIYWSEPQTPGEHSFVKNRWIEICYQQKCAYGQWEDAGPFGEDDVAYVFGTARPANDQGLEAGIDVSPALNDYLGLNGDAKVRWRFIDGAAVPAGPWHDIITR